MGPKKATSWGRKKGGSRWRDGLSTGCFIPTVCRGGQLFGVGSRVLGEKGRSRAKKKVGVDGDISG